MSFRSMFFRDIFYWLKLYSKFLTILVYALVGVSSLLLFMVKINQWKKSLKVISFTYTLLSKLERQFYLFWGWSKGGGGGELEKLISGTCEVGNSNKPSAVKCKNTTFCYKGIHIHNIFLLLEGNKMEVEENTVSLEKGCAHIFFVLVL